MTGSHTSSGLPLSTLGKGGMAVKDDVVVLCGEQLAEGQVVLVDEEPGRQCWLRRE